jgi:hypothetical protein
MCLLVEIYRDTDVQPFVILEARKTDSCHVVYHLIQANWLHVNHSSKFWLLGNVILQRFMSPSDQGYLDFIEMQLTIMAT